MEANYKIQVNFSNFSNIEIQPTEKILKCVQCNKEFTDIAKVEDHLLLHTSIEYHTCKYCNEKFTMKIMLNKHLKSHETAITKNKNCFECVHCKKQFDFIDHLLSHCKVHFKNLWCNENEAEEKDSAVNTKVDANENDNIKNDHKSCASIKKEKEEYADKEETVKIAEIKKRGKKRKNIKEEETETKNEEIKIEQRRRKPVQLMKKENIIQIKTNANTIYKCKHCHASYISDVECKTHLHSHRKVKFMKGLSDLKGHYTSVKLVNDEKECMLCGIVFISVEKSLSDHVVSAHPEVNISKLCLFCGKIFPTTNDLCRHTRTHTGEKPFMCSECPFSCSRHDNLRKHFAVHMKTV